MFVKRFLGVITGAAALVAVLVVLNTTKQSAFAASKGSAEAGEAAEKVKPAIEGAELGKWTMDYYAAKELAKEKRVPVILNFTGSDWCPWCVLMDEKVFSQKEWQDYAKDKVALVWLDFPRNKSLVPMHLVARNQELVENYGVQGFPTYIVLDADGKRIGQLGAARDITPQKFISELKKITDK